MHTEAPAGRGRADQGFSLVELAVVIVLVAALTAIAVPAFLSERAHAGDAAARSDARRVGVRVSAWYAEHDGGGTPSVTTSGGHYLVDGEDAGPVTAGVRLGTHAAAPAPTDAVDTTGWTSTTWCVNVLYPKSSDGVQSVSSAGVHPRACP